MVIVGQELEVIVLELDVEGRKLSLGHKQTTDNPWEKYAKTYGENEAKDTCSICLAQIEEGEIVREINKCKHFLHINCADKWFEENITCPICRTIILRVNKCVFCGDINSDVKIGNCGHFAHKECFKFECHTSVKTICPFCDKDTGKQCMEIDTDEV